MSARRWWSAAAALLTVATVGGLVPSLGRVLPVAEVKPAAASAPGNRFLQVVPEIQNALVGTTLSVRAKLLKPDITTLYAEPAPADSASGPILIDFELEGVGPLNPDGTNPETADHTCTVAIGTNSCTISIQSSLPATHLLRAWIDRDDRDERPNGVPCSIADPSCGATEADRSEGRLADKGVPPAKGADCLKLSEPGADTSAPNPGPVSAPVLGPAVNPGSPDEADANYDDCSAGTAEPGIVAEPDATDVVSLTWGSGTTVLDCASNRDGAEVDPRKTGTDAQNPGDPGQIRCLVVDGVGSPLTGVRLDGENLAGANDPDDAGRAAAGNATADYVSPGGGLSVAPNPPFCETAADGRCIARVPQTEFQTGPADICIWIDGDNDNEFTTLSNNDGAGCGEPLVPDNIDGSDVVRVLWESPRPSGVNASPETQSVTPTQLASVTVSAYDQFGDPAPGVDVNAELFTGSISDGDQNRPSSPDRFCRTATTGTDPAIGTCKINMNSAEVGSDALCVFLGALGEADMTGDQASGTCLGEGLLDPSGDEGKPVPTTDRVDVVRINWQTPAAPPPAPSRRAGYWLVANDGGIFAFGDASFFGSAGAIKLNKPVVGMAATADQSGYWLVATDGGIFAYGNARFFGSTGSIRLNQPIVGMGATSTNNGYWLVASDGGIFAYGDAPFFGSTGNIRLNQPVVGMTPTPTNKGYWFVAKDGGIFAYGDAPFYGSTGSIKLNSPIVAMASTATGKGYWLVAADGGIFAYGDAAFYGSAGSLRLTSPIVTMIPTSTGKGYWLVAADGGIFSYGDATFKGSTGSIRLNAPIVGGDGF